MILCAPPAQCALALPKIGPTPVASRGLTGTSGERLKTEFDPSFRSVDVQDRVPVEVLVNTLRRVRIPLRAHRQVQKHKETQSFTVSVGEHPHMAFVPSQSAGPWHFLWHSQMPTPGPPQAHWYPDGHSVPPTVH